MTVDAARPRLRRRARRCARATSSPPTATAARRARGWASRMRGLRAALAQHHDLLPRRLRRAAARSQPGRDLRAQPGAARVLPARPDRRHGLPRHQHGGRGRHAGLGDRRAVGADRGARAGVPADRDRDRHADGDRATSPTGRPRRTAPSGCARAACSSPATRRTSCPPNGGFGGNTGSRTRATSRGSSPRSSRATPGRTCSTRYEAERLPLLRADRRAGLHALRHARRARARHRTTSSRRSRTSSSRSASSCARRPSSSEEPDDGVLHLHPSAPAAGREPGRRTSCSATGGSTLDLVRPAVRGAAARGRRRRRLGTGRRDVAHHRCRAVRRGSTASRPAGRRWCARTASSPGAHAGQPPATRSLARSRPRSEPRPPEPVRRRRARRLGRARAGRAGARGRSGQRRP